MKKFFLLAILAVTFLACNEIYSGSDLPISDEVALKAVTTHSVARLGTTRASVEKAYRAAGFQKVDTGTVPAGMVVREALKAKKSIAGEEVEYVYGMPANYQTFTQAERMNCMADRLNSGKGCIIATATYQNDTLAAVYAAYYGPLTKKGSLLYAAISDGLYRRISPIDTTVIQWTGSIYDYNTEGSTPYSDHSQFVDTVISVDGIQAFEFIKNADGATPRTSGLYYEGIWVYPDEALAEKMKEELVNMPYVVGIFNISDVKANN